MSLVLVDHSHPCVSIISLNRPDKRNALNIELMDAISQTIQEIPLAKRVLVIKGEGLVFCSGLDLTEAADTAKKEKSAQSLKRMLNTVFTASLLTIALVSGAAVAGGGGLIAACDYVIADPKTLFGFPEVRRGLVPAQILPFLKRKLKERDLSELLLFGELIDAQKAYAIGLINQILEKERFLPEVLSLADRIKLGAPEAIAATKKLLRENILPDELVYEAHRQSRASPEAQEGIAAFLEHRPAKWTN